MTASVIIPHHNNQATLPRTLESVRAAADGLDVEIVLVDDDEGHGASWARNRGLERARGDVIFFVDADDTVERGFLSRPLAEMERTGADMCIFEFSGCSLKRDYNLSGNTSIRAALLPAFLGYSFDDVRRWNAGGALGLHRELGSVWRVAFRRDFIERHAIRFDESLHIYEDATFLCDCAIFAESVVSLREPLYNYIHNPAGNIATETGSPRHWQYKFDVLKARERMEKAGEGGVWKYCEASCVLSALEIMRRWRGRGIMKYLSSERVRSAVRNVPISFRHPIAAAGVIFLRILSWF